MAINEASSDVATFMRMRAFDRGDEDAFRALREAPGATVLRYRAPAALEALRGEHPDPRFGPGRGTTLSIAYGQGVWPAERSGPDSRLVGDFVASWAYDASGRAIAAATLLGRPHVGIQVAYGTVADPAWRSTIAAWYRDIHARDVLAVDGVIGAARFVVQDSSEPRAGEHLVIFLLDDDPAVVMARVRARVEEWRGAGRTPSPGRASKAVFNGPFVRETDR